MATCIALSGCTVARVDVSPTADPCVGCHGDEASPAPPDRLHRQHLRRSSEHAPVVCESCHVVPATTAAPGHADSQRPAEVVLPGVGVYDPDTRSCSNVTCHGADLASAESDTPVWAPWAPSPPRCAHCHGNPPAAPHPTGRQCALCHGTLAAATHGDGQVTLQLPPQCGACHGAGDDPTPADGFHRVHAEGLSGVARPVGCTECHPVPGGTAAPGHLDASPAEVTLEGGALYVGGSCSGAWCHSGPGAKAPAPSFATPVTGDPACDLCHGEPPPPPHPGVTDCALCHGPMVQERHADGVVDEDMPEACDACHGADGDPAPDHGAHRAHLDRGVACETCHQVPSEVLDTGHVDTDLPADVRFGGIALSGGSTPSYEPQGSTCAATWCHGRPEWGAPADPPSWNDPDGTAGACGACHGLPPPAPHPSATQCAVCHGEGGPASHVDGVVTFD